MTESQADQIETGAETETEAEAGAAMTSTAAGVRQHLPPSGTVRILDLPDSDREFVRSALRRDTPLQLIGEAANSGITEARYDFGGMLSEGAGVAPDPVAAAEQYRLAAEDGMAAAQIEYATILYLGKGVPQDRDAALILAQEDRRARAWRLDRRLDVHRANLIAWRRSCKSVGNSVGSGRFIKKQVKVTLWPKRKSGRQRNPRRERPRAPSGASAAVANGRRG